MKYIIYGLIGFLGILKAEASGGDEPPKVQADCWRCTAERCQKSPDLAESCIDVCKKAASYNKIKSVCKNEKELMGALKKTEGLRLAEIIIPEAKELDKAGGIETSHLTPKGIFMLLQDLKLIPSSKNPDDADQALVIKKGEAGLYSTQIYIVEVKENYRGTSDGKFVIKGLRNVEQGLGAKENTPQKEMQGLEKVKQFIVPQLKGTGVNIAETKGAFWYYNQSGFSTGFERDDKNYVVIMSIASGVSLAALTEQYAEGALSDADWNDMMRHIGEATGKVHYALASPETKKSLEAGKLKWADFKTTIHGDFHGGNIFYDPKTKQVTFIDVASMTDTLIDKVSPSQDFSDLCMRTQVIFKKAHFNKKVSDGFQSFDVGYASAFPTASQDMVKTGVALLCQG